MATTIELGEDQERRVRPTLAHGLTARSAGQAVLSIRDTIPKAEAERFIAAALRDIRVFMQEQDVSPAGPPFSICREHGRVLDVEAGWPTARPVAGTPRIHSGGLPRSLAGPRASGEADRDALEESVRRDPLR